MGGIRANRRPALALRVTGDAVANLPRPGSGPSIVFEDVDDAQALLVVIESAGTRSPRSTRSPAWPNSVWPRSWPSAIASVSSSCRRSTLAMLPRSARPRACGSVASGSGRRRPETPASCASLAERFRVDDPIAVALERGADGIFGLGTEPFVSTLLAACGAVVPLVVRAALEWSSFDYVRQKTRPVCKFRHGEHLGERLAEIEEEYQRVPRSTPLRTAVPVSGAAARGVPRMIRARRGQVVPVVGSDDEHIARTQARDQLERRASKRSDSPRNRPGRSGDRRPCRNRRGSRKSVSPASPASHAPPHPSPHHRSLCGRRDAPACEQVFDFPNRNHALASSGQSIEQRVAEGGRAKSFRFDVRRKSPGPPTNSRASPADSSIDRRELDRPFRRAYSAERG